MVNCCFLYYSSYDYSKRIHIKFRLPKPAPNSQPFRKHLPLGVRKQAQTRYNAFSKTENDLFSERILHLKKLVL